MEIRCGDCEYCKVLKWTRGKCGNNGRGECFCTHPASKECFDIIKHKSTENGDCFISYTVGISKSPRIGTSPRWCPKSFMERPVQLTKKQAYKIINEKRPEGLFFVQDNYLYTGLANINGETDAEEFIYFDDCKSWLKEIKERHVKG